MFDFNEPTLEQIERARDDAMDYLLSEGHDIGMRLEKDLGGAIASAMYAHFARGGISSNDVLLSDEAIEAAASA